MIFANGIEWLANGNFLCWLTKTNLVLIPKVERAASMKDLPPIALCNVLYKFISKVLCNRLKQILPNIINPAQSAFVKERAIQDNALIAFEAIHSMKRKNRGRYGEFALKVDISKAYDKVNWQYLLVILHIMGFSNK